MGHACGYTGRRWYIYIIIRLAALVGAKYIKSEYINIPLYQGH